MIKNILIGIGVVIILFMAFLVHSGLLAKVEFEQKEIGPFTVVYETHRGPYSGVTPTMDAVYYSLVEDGIETTRGIGIYYDNPEVVPAEKLRSDVGSVIEDEDISKLTALGDKYKVMTINRSNRIVAELPYENTVSIILGVMKVYPELKKYKSDNSIKDASVMEIYDQPNKKIYYIANIPN